jgi:hypothetical protein
MNIQVVASTLFAAAICGGLPSSAAACSCGGPIPSSAQFRSAVAVFVGTVERVDKPEPWSRRNSDGSISAGLGYGPEVVTLAVTRAFRGVAETRVRLKRISGASCEIPFAVGEAWLIYASQEQGDLRASGCSRSRLVSQADEDLKYLHAAAAGQPQGLVYGNVFRQIAGADGQPAQQALFEPLKVVALGAGRRFAVTTDKWGPYQIVLPPGDFEMWVERAGVPVTASVNVRISNGDERRMTFSAKFQ